MPGTAREQQPQRSIRGHQRVSGSELRREMGEPSQCNMIEDVAVHDQMRDAAPVHLGA